MLRWVLAIALLAAGCAPQESQRLAENRQDVIASLQPIRYVRTDADGRTEITVSPTGAMAVHGVRYGERSTQLSEFQIMQLARLFEPWAAELEENYPPPDDLPGPAIVVLQYGDRSVTVGEGAQTVPESYWRARAWLEALARDLPEPK